MKWPTFDAGETLPDVLISGEEMTFFASMTDEQVEMCVVEQFAPDDRAEARQFLVEMRTWAKKTLPGNYGEG